MKIHNFSAGPAILPNEVMEEASKACVDFKQTGLSLLEMSHRSAAFEAVMEEAEQLLRDLLGLSDDFAVLFLTGGASSQFFMVPMNILNEDERAAYTDTGTWAAGAIKEAKHYGTIDIVASSKEANYNYIPKSFDVDPASRYIHITTNNTIFGTEWHQLDNFSVPIVADMSSDFLSRPVDISKYDLIYAGAQKNLGPAGVTVVIIRKSLLGRAKRYIPTMLNYSTHFEKGSMYNTPPVFPIYVSMLTMRWIKNMGGLEPMEQRNIEKANLIYNEIDRNSLFTGTTTVEDRSRMNVCFVPVNPNHADLFLKKAKAAGIDGIKGHRSVGGFRASIYNAMPIESVQVLVDLMKQFEQENA
jgi:phosphoserine aminotransferase